MSAPKKVPRRLVHQEEGIKFLHEREAAALFDEQGLGKSRQLIDAIAQGIQEGALDGALIVCPNTVKTTWGEEIEHYSDLQYAVFGARKKSPTSCVSESTGSVLRHQLRSSCRRISVTTCSSSIQADGEPVADGQNHLAISARHCSSRTACNRLSSRFPNSFQPTARMTAARDV